MMLRTRSASNANAASKAAETAASKPTEEPLAKRGTKKASTETAAGEPEVKRARTALSEIHQGISSITIDSTKRASSSSRKSPSPDALPRIEEDPEAMEVEAKELPEPEVDPAPEVDFDAGVSRDPFAVSEFASDIFKYYRSREKSFMVDDYMKRQKHIRAENRTGIIDWMVEMQETLELNHETLYLGVKLVDLFLSRRDHVTIDELQIVACAAVFIACKFDERSPPLIDDFVFMAEDCFGRNDFIRMEMKMLEVVGFDLGAPLSYRYVRRYARVISSDMQTLTLARYITETSLMFYDLCGCAESRLAAAAFLLALKMKNSTATWTPVLHKYSGYREEELEPLMWELNHMLHLRSTTDKYARLRTVYKKYSHEVFYRSAAVRPLPDKFSAKRRIQAPEGQGFDRRH